MDFNQKQNWLSFWLKVAAVRKAIAKSDVAFNTARADLVDLFGEMSNQSPIVKRGIKDSKKLLCLKDFHVTFYFS